MKSDLILWNNQETIIVGNLLFWKKWVENGKNTSMPFK